MALIKCNNCQGEISDKAKNCIHCGCTLNIEKKSNQNKNSVEVSDELKSKIKFLESDKQKLEKELNIQKEKNKKLQKKQDNKQTKKLLIKKIKIIIKKFINLIRYLIGLFFIIGTIASIKENFRISWCYFLFAISIMPILYNLCQKYIKFNNKIKIILEIITPIIAFFLIGIFGV